MSIMNSWNLVIKHTAGGMPDREFFLRAWIKRLINDEPEPQPYLRLVGPQCSGKSIFHEAIGLLTTVKSVAIELIDPAPWNTMLEHIAVGVIDEIDLSPKRMRRRLASWQRPGILLHGPMQIPRAIANKLRWIECTNHNAANLDFPITTLPVERINLPFPKSELFSRLNRECEEFVSKLSDGNFKGLQ